MFGGMSLDVHPRTIGFRQSSPNPPAPSDHGYPAGHSPPVSRQRNRAGQLAQGKNHSVADQFGQDDRRIALSHAATEAGV